MLFLRALTMPSKAIKTRSKETLTGYSGIGTRSKAQLTSLGDYSDYCALSFLFFYGHPVFNIHSSIYCLGNMQIETYAKIPVLVTGASGYLASWIIRELLLMGHPVRGTVRSLAAK